jgi:uncharacterized membrane protein YphA (DoxX/SURF4 family)
MYVLFVIGRILFGGYFIYNALGHFMKLGALSGYAASKKIPMPKAAVIISGVALLLGGLSIVINFSVQQLVYNLVPHKELPSTLLAA